MSPTLFSGANSKKMTFLLLPPQASMEAQHTALRERLGEVNSYMKARKLPKWLKEEIREYVIWTSKSTDTALLNEHEIVEDLSPLLRCKVALAVNDTFLRNLPIFKFDDLKEGSSEAMANSMFILELALSMKMVCYSPFEVVINEGDIGSQMYFIVRGAVEITVSDRIDSSKHHPALKRATPRSALIIFTPCLLLSKYQNEMK